MEINNTQIYRDVLMSMHNLIEHSNNYSKDSGSSWKYHRDESNGKIANSESIRRKIKLTVKILDADNEKNVEIVVPISYSRNHWKRLETPFNCEINIILTWFTCCVIFSATRTAKYAITDINIKGPIVTLSTNDIAKLLEELKSGFKRAIYGNKYQSKVSIKRQNQYLDILIDSSFQGVNRLFVFYVWKW